MGDKKDKEFMEEPLKPRDTLLRRMVAVKRDRAVSGTREEKEASQRFPQVEQSNKLPTNDKRKKREKKGNSLIYKSREDLFKDKTIRPWKKAKRFIQLPRIIVADRRLSNEAARVACILSMFDMSKKKQGKEQGKKSVRA